MKLLIITQKVDLNDDVLGFMHGWIKEFAKHCELVTVICLEKGDYDLSQNVKILSLGKESGSSRLKYIWRFYKYIWQERKNYDKVFVHMNQEYVVLGGILWRLLSKKISLWYAHGYVPFSLKVAEKLSHIVFTSTKSGFRLNSKKVNIVGQGIDVNKFKVESRKSKVNENLFKIITVGRISPVKDYETLIKAVEALENEDINLRVNIIGGAGLPEQEKYLTDLKRMASEKKIDNIINFVGAVPNKNIVSYLQSADLFVSMSRTGSLDKTIVEAMASGLPILTSNEALKEVLGDIQDLLMYSKGDYKKLALKIKLIKNMSSEDKKDLGYKLRDIVVKDHSLEAFIKRIVKEI